MGVTCRPSCWSQYGCSPCSPCPTLDKNIKSKIIKLISKLSGKKEAQVRAKFKVESLLAEASEKKLEENAREESFLDKLLQVYSTEEREKALQSVGQEDPVKSSLGILSGDYLDRDRYSSASRSSRLIERQLRKLLRNS